jgi:cell wall assembly regulator SMI1
MDPEVTTSWARIVTWCRDHAPETAAAIRPPAGPALLGRAEAATGGAWPEDLRAWYRLADGTERITAGGLLPFYLPLPLATVMEHWAMWQRIWAEIAAASPHAAEWYDTPRLETEPAGTAAMMFLPSFVPIAEDLCGNDLFVDTRQGRLRGCVTEFAKGDTDSRGPRWRSVTAMLAELATALAQGRTIGGWRPRVEDGRLDWDVAPGPAAPPGS